MAVSASPKRLFGPENTPTPFAWTISALTKACWSWIRPRSLPSPTLLRVRTSPSDCSPDRVWVPGARRRWLWESSIGWVVVISTPPSSSTIFLKPVKSTST